MMKNWEDRKWKGCRKVGEYKVMFGNSFYFLFSKACFWGYKKKKNNFLVFLKSETCLVS